MNVGNAAVGSEEVSEPLWMGYSDRNPAGIFIQFPGLWPPKSKCVQHYFIFSHYRFARLPDEGNVACMIYNIHEQEWESLKKLMIEADLFAIRSMRDTRHIEPTLFIHGSDGISILQPEKMSNVEEKDAFVELARLMCIAKAADATVFVSEAWQATAKPGKALDLSKAPSEYKDREEVLIMMGETGHKCQHRIVPMLRSNDGRFLGFGESRSLDTEKVAGRFANFIPQVHPDLKAQEQAKELLREMGIQAEKKEKRREQGRWMG